MNQSKSRAALASVLLATAAIWCASAWAAQPQDSVESRKPIIAIEGVAVVDVTRGETVGPRTVMIVNGSIAAMAEPEAIVIPAGAVRVDGRGRYLMPGLVDMHVHLFNNATHRPPNEWAFPLFVANGITGVREMACAVSDMPTLSRWREARARGDLIAPHVLASGVTIRRDSVEAVRRQVREAHSAGADFVKVFSEVGERPWRAMIEEGRALQIPVCGHIPTEIRLLDAATAGQRSNEHLTQLYEACSAKEEKLLQARTRLAGKEIVAFRDAQEREVLESFDQLVCDRTAAALAKTKQAQVPTLVLAHFEAHGSWANLREDNRWRYLRADEQVRWERIGKDNPVTDEKLAAQRLEVSGRIIKTLHAAGVRILAGTDAPMPLVYPGFALHKELELLVEAGLSPADALRSATLWPAEFLGISETSGSIAAGKRADLLLLGDNPLSRISHTQHIRAVILDGRLLKRGDLDALLNSAGRDPSQGAAGVPARLSGAGPSLQDRQ